LRLAVVGVALGFVLAVATNRVISSMLFGIDTTDVLTYAGVLLAILPIIIIAAMIPALRAARVDPITALRTD
jgi:ABC-type antimicrobial peptide transport system permease subunit